MKQTPQEQQIAARMAPGVLSREGFLDGDRRALAEIIDTDRSAVESAGLTGEQLADGLEAVLKAAMAAMGREVAVGGWTARYREAMGRIPCPWGGCGVFPKGEVEMTQPTGGGVLRFTPLSVHLIRRHSFYQGRGTRYRLEPLVLARALGMI